MQRLSRLVKGSPVYTKLESSNGRSPPTAAAISHTLLGRASRLRFRLYLVFVLLIATLLAAHAIRLNPGIASKLPIPLWRTPTPIPRNLHVLIPASAPNIDLCRNLVTGAVLNYPTPTLVNWGRNSTNGSFAGNSYNLAKITGVHDWIMRQTKTQRASGDLLLVIDGYDVWFQLRPSVLVDRFHWLLRESNKQTKERMGHAFREEHIGQSVIFGASKRCSPNFDDDIGCWPLPESPLPADLYGYNTDTRRGHNEFSSFRERFLDAGVAMGTIEDMRQIFLRARSHKDEKQRGGGGNPQSVLNTIFGQQEFQRLVMHEKHQSIIGKIHRKIDGWLGVTRSSILDEHPTHEMMPPEKVRSHDFGIALDYYSMISHNTNNSKWDGRFITYAKNNHSLVLDESDCAPRLKPLAYDIERTYMASKRVQQGVLQNKTWADLPLYTNICTGNVPVLIHHQTPNEDRQALWEEFWMGRTAGEIFKGLNHYSKLKSPEDSYVDIGVNTGSALTDTGMKYTWDELCKPYEEELFGGPI